MKTYSEKKSSRKFLAAVLAAVMTVAAAAFVLAACNDGDNSNGAKLIFSDEFDTELNTDLWTVKDELRKGGYWDDEAVFTENGNLVIRTSYDEERNTFLTGAVTTEKSFLHHYGYYEARVKAPEAAGIWSAFWIMCDKMGDENPDASVGGAEIDIYESAYYPATANWLADFQAAIHVGGYGSNWIRNEHMFSAPQKEGIGHAYEDWYVFALDWQPDGYKFYMNNELIWETDCDDNVSSVDSYVFLSVEVNGSNGNPNGTPQFPLNGNALKQNGDLSEIFPADFLVDYVRVWDKNPHTA